MGVRLLTALVVLALAGCDPFAGDWRGSGSDTFDGRLYPFEMDLTLARGQLRYNNDGGTRILTGTYEPDGRATMVSAEPDGGWRAEYNGELSAESGRLRGEFVYVLPEVTRGPNSGTTRFDLGRY